MIPRRTLLGAGPLALAACSKEGAYFGRPTPPGRQQLVCATNLSTASLDPAKSLDLREGHVIRALFEGLTGYHPLTAEPIAGIATHYETLADGQRFTFYLRGHPSPRGTRLPDTNTLRQDYLNGVLTEDLSRAHSAPPQTTPVYWSDGSPVTAHDVVYSWRRVLDPATGAGYAYLLYYIENAQAVNAGSLPPERLGVEALDEFTLEIRLRAATPFFVRLLSWQTFRPVPRQAVEAARRKGNEAAWTDPESIVVSGPFLLKGQRRHEAIHAVRNPRYYESALVALERVSFLLTGDATTAVNLYRYGSADLLLGIGLPPVMFPALSGRRDFRVGSSFGTYFPCFNIKQAPFDNVLVRYAFNMAVDKGAMAKLFGDACIPARTLVPPVPGYTCPATIPALIGGRACDVLRFNPAAAREVLSLAGFPGGVDSNGRRLALELLAPSGDVARTHCEILKQQLESNLSVSVTIATQEFNLWLQGIFGLNYRGMTVYEDWGFYRDPNWFLDQFVSGSFVNATGWTDAKYDAMLAAANATADPVLRMQEMANCELYLLKAMPFMPVYHHVLAFPQKPYVRGIRPNVMEVHSFKHAWVDTNWSTA